jgi:hypothetical protein
MNRVATSDFDEILSASSSSVDATHQRNDDQVLAALTAVRPDEAYRDIVAEEFAAVLKTLAARRYQLDKKCTPAQRRQLAANFVGYISSTSSALPSSARNTQLEWMSNCVWALGTLKMSKEDFVPLQPSSDDTAGSPSAVTEPGETRKHWSTNAGTQTWDHLLGTVVQLCVDPGAAPSRVQLFRLVSGLGKMGMSWQDMPSSFRDLFILHTSNITNPDGAAAGTQDVSREVASALYILGQIGATKSSLPPEYAQSLLRQLGADNTVQGASALCVPLLQCCCTLCSVSCYPSCCCCCRVHPSGPVQRAARPGAHGVQLGRRRAG